MNEAGEGGGEASIIHSITHGRAGHTIDRKQASLQLCHMMLLALKLAPPDSLFGVQGMMPRQAGTTSNTTASSSIAFRGRQLNKASHFRGESGKIRTRLVYVFCTYGRLC